MKRMKNVAFEFCFAGRMRKKKPCQNVIGTFEFSRANPLMLCFVLIIFIDYLYIKRAKLAQLAKDGDCNVQDLGSNPRSSIFPFIFLQ